MSQSKSRFCFFVLFAAMLWMTKPLQAGGPLEVTGINASSPGQPYRWKTNSIPYKTDLGGLGNQTNTQANSLIAEAAQVWGNVASADIVMQRAGSLSYDVTKNNILTFANALNNCSDSKQPTLSMVYDINGGIIEALGMDKNSVLGLSMNVCSDDSTGEYLRAWAVMNGRFIDGQPDSSTHSSATLAEFKLAFIHEFGHLLGLDHAQINLHCYTESDCTSEELAGVPLMFPVMLDNIVSTLKTDDISAISTLYPNSSFAATTGRIQGRVLFSDGISPAQGFNVIARKVGDSKRTAVSSVSGFLYTASAGNVLSPDYALTINDFGSHDPALIGYFDITGLPPGEYTVEVEAINNSGSIPFTGSSSVGPIGNYDFQFKMPGTCSLQYLKYPSSPTDNCSDYTTISVQAGETVKTNTDIILLGTPSRYDAWEDGE
jgi:hypothetical protein